MIEDYKEEVSSNENLGELYINSNKQIPYEKQIWDTKGLRIRNDKL